MPLVTFSYNIAHPETTKMSPFYRINGREGRLLIDVSLGVNSSEEDVQEIILKLNVTRKQVLRQREREQTKQKSKYDANKRYLEYSVGEK